jgi:hypothetical protein
MLELIFHLTRLRSTLPYLCSRLFSPLVYPFSSRGISVGESSSEENSGDVSIDGIARDNAGNASYAERTAAGSGTDYGRFQHREVTPQHTS